MRVVFLDIDGVLVFANSDECVSGRLGVMDRAAVGRLNRILADTGAVVVLSSTWRYNRDGPRTPERVLARAGFSGTIYGRTPMWAIRSRGLIVESPSRTDEIKMYLDEHPEIKSYVCLDDDALRGIPEGRHVATTWSSGLQEEHVAPAVRALLTPVPEAE